MVNILYAVASVEYFGIYRNSLGSTGILCNFEGEHTICSSLCRNTSVNLRVNILYAVASIGIPWDLKEYPLNKIKTVNISSDFLAQQEKVTLRVNIQRQFFYL